MLVGGDFNTQLNFCCRCELLRGFASEHNLSITNDNVELTWDQTWTFRSSLGHKRQLDYVLVDQSFHVSRAEATNQLDLGSDHRAVVCCLDLYGPLPERPTSKGKLTWCGSVSYSQILDSTVSRTPSSLQSLETCVIDAAVASEAVTAAPKQQRPWQKADLQQLRRARRECRDGDERRHLSKLITSATNKEVRL